jgi:hypothetical protein
VVTLTAYLPLFFACILSRPPAVPTAKKLFGPDQRYIALEIKGVALSCKRPFSHTTVGETAITGRGMSFTTTVLGREKADLHPWVVTKTRQSPRAWAAAVAIVKKFTVVENS